MRIADREVGLGHPCFIAAEISGNHNGDPNRALRLIYAANDAGADAVKFQCFTMDEILGLRGTGQAPPPWESMTLPELYAKVITPHDWFPALFAEARRIGIIPFASVFGRESLDLLKSLDCPAYKIAKPERRIVALIDMALATDKPVLVSMPQRGDLDFHDSEVGWPHEIYCPASYPVGSESLRLGLYDRACIGLSCHYPDPMVGPVAVACGAHYLEFHLTLDDGVPTLDDCVNLTARQFRQMVEWTRQAEAML